MPGPQDRPGGHDHVAGAHIVADPPHPGPLGHRRVDEHAPAVVEHRGPLDHHDGVGPWRHGRTGHDARRLARTHRVLTRATCRDGGDHVEHRSGNPDVRGVHGVPVERGVVPRGDRLARHDVVGGDAAVGLRERDLDGRLGGHPDQDVFERVGQRDHGFRRYRPPGTADPPRPLGDRSRRRVRRCPRGGRPRPGTDGTPDPGPLAATPAPPWPAGSRSSCRCRSGRHRTSTRRRRRDRGVRRWRR